MSVGEASMTDRPLNFDEAEHVHMPRVKARKWDRGNVCPADVLAKRRLSIHAEEQFFEPSEARRLKYPIRSGRAAWRQGR